MRINPMFLWLVGVLVSLLSASSAFAAGPAGFGVYYTYGGFEPAEMAFERVQSLMNFSGSGYLAMVGGFMILSFLITVGSGFVNMATGKQTTIFTSLAPMFIGYALFLGLFTPKTDLVVYDPVLNTQSPATLSLPIGIVYPAVFINHIERFVIDLYDATATSTTVQYTDNDGTLRLYTNPPVLYGEHGGAVGMDVFANVQSEFTVGGDAAKTMNAYVKDCVMFELVRPGSALTQDELISPPAGKTFMDVIVAANSPANWTMSYITAGAPAGGEPDTCENVYTVLEDFYVTNAETNNKAALENSCAARGYDPTAFGQCQNLLADVINRSFPSAGGSLLPSGFVSNMTVADVTATYLGSASPQTAATFMALKQSAEQGSVMGAISGIVNPRMIDSYVAYTFFLIPILAMFLPTSLGQKAMMLVLSLMLWNMLVRVLDVITFHMWMSEYNRVVSNMGDIGVGIAAYFRLPLEVSKHLKSFADLRSSVFLLATAVSGALFKFGDSAMSRLADRASAEHSSIPNQVVDQGNRASAQKDVMVGAQRAGMMMALAEGVHGANNLAQGMAYSEFAGGVGGAGKLSAAGGGSNLAGTESTAAGYTTQTTSGANTGMDGNTALTQGLISSSQTVSQQKALKDQGGGSASAVAGQVSYQTTSDNVAASKAATDVASNMAARNGSSLTGARDHKAGFEAKNQVAGQYGMEAMYAATHGNGPKQFQGSMEDFMQQMKSQGSVVMNDGSKMDIKAGTDGRSQQTQTYTGNGYTGTSEIKDGKVQNTEIKNGSAWSATLGEDGQVLASNNRALAGSIDQTVAAKASESAGESWNQQVALAKQKGSSVEHSNATQSVKTKSTAFSKEMATSLAEKLVKSGAIKATEQSSTENAIAAKLSADPIRTGALMATMLGGAPGAAAGGAVGGLMATLGAAIGLKAEVSGSHAKKSASGTAVESGLQNSNEQSVQNALKEAVSETSANSKTLADIRKDSLSKTVTDSNGHSKNYGSVLSYDQSKGFTVRSEMETGFIREQSQLPQYQHLKSEEERIAAANNDISKADRQVTGRQFGEYLERKALEDGQIAGVKGSIENSGSGVQGAFTNAAATTGADVNKGQGSITGPGAGPSFSLAPQVHTQAAQSGSDINGGATYISGSRDKVGMFNSNTPSPDGYGRQTHVAPSVNLGTAQLNASGGQRSAPSTDFERVSGAVSNSANAVYNSTPVQVPVNIASGLAGAVPKIMKGLEGL